jgi:hypothetical protein
MSKRDWLKHRSRGIHITIRDVDCKDYDVEQMIKDFKDMHVEFFSFFCGGYITTYPTKLRYQRMSPWLEGRDLTGDIISTAHRYGIKAIAMADLGVMGELAAIEHPEWCALDREGRPCRINDELTIPSLLGGYQEYGRQMVEEIIGRYPDVDGIKFGGGSYGFQSYGSGIDYNEACRRDFRDKYHEEIPAERNWANPVWKKFLKWRYETATAKVLALGAMVKSIDPDMMFMGNATCFGDPDWTTRASLDMEEMAPAQDAIQVEAQSRVRLDSEDEARWQAMYFPAEEANFISSVTDRPAWVVCSYFLAWPWRRNAVPPVEQKVYLAQIAANGGSPMVNLSGGTPKVHEDKRGFAATRELYAFLDQHKAYYEDASAAELAIVYSQETLVHYGQERPKQRYVDAIRGCEEALTESHVPFDIISTRLLSPEKLARYRVLLLPNLACLSQAQAEALRAFARRGGGIVASHETSLYDEEGRKRPDFLLADLLGCSYKGVTPGPLSGMVNDVMMQSYFRLSGSHPLTEGLAGTDVIPAAGRYCAVEPAAGTAIPLRFYPPFRVMPEGVSYGAVESADTPMAVAHDSGGSRTVYFPAQVDKYYGKLGYPDLKTLLVNAARWVAQADQPLRVEAPPTLSVTLREQKGRRLVHMVNLTGGRRFFTELVPLRDIGVSLRAEGAPRVRRAFLLSDGKPLTLAAVAGRYDVVVPEVRDYDVLVLEE